MFLEVKFPTELERESGGDIDDPPIFIGVASFPPPSGQNAKIINQSMTQLIQNFGVILFEIKNWC